MRCLPEFGEKIHANWKIREKDGILIRIQVHNTDFPWKRTVRGEKPVPTLSLSDIEVFNKCVCPIMAVSQVSLQLTTMQLLDRKLTRKPLYLAITIDGLFTRTSEAQGATVNWNFRYRFPWQTQHQITLRLMKKGFLQTDQVKAVGSVRLEELVRTGFVSDSMPLRKKEKVVGYVTCDVRLNARERMGNTGFLPIPSNIPAENHQKLTFSDIQLLTLIYQTSNRLIEVHKCRIISSNKPAIVKISHCSDNDHFNRVQKEGLILCKVRHANVCEFYESWLDGRGGYDHWLVMEWVDGVSLKEELERREAQVRPWREEEVKGCVGEMLNAFAYLQSQSICHSDIQPSNLIFTSSGQLKIIDFGLSLVLHPPTPHQLTYPVSGTVNFLSPLQIQAYRAHETTVKHDPYKSDVYSLGLVFLSMCSVKCVEGMNEGERLEERLQEEIAGLNVGNWMKEVLRRMLSVSERHRPDFCTLKKWVGGMTSLG